MKPCYLKWPVKVADQLRTGQPCSVTAGSALAFFVHAGFILVPAGVGLMHAGVTNSCIMGMMLSIESSRTDRNTTPCCS
jgi:hypothetical protein